MALLILFFVEKSYQIDAIICTLNCRRTIEISIKWMCSVDYLK